MNITLIGMPLVGKSTVGRRLAKRLGYRFVDIDLIIEKESKLKLQDIIETSGEDKFLKMEEAAVLSLCKPFDSVISPGGSIIYSKPAIDFLKLHSIIIFLDAPFSAISKRAADYPRRGIIKRDAKNLEELFRQRRPLYLEFANTVLRVNSEASVDTTVDELLKKIF